VVGIRGGVKGRSIALLLLEQIRDLTLEGDSVEVISARDDSDAEAHLAQIKTQADSAFLLKELRLQLRDSPCQKGKDGDSQDFDGSLKPPLQLEMLQHHFGVQKYIALIQ
jgi:hypothetical protein